MEEDQKHYERLTELLKEAPFPGVPGRRGDGEGRRPESGEKGH